MSSNLVILHLFEGAEDFLSLSVDQKIIVVDFDGKFIMFKIEFTTESKLQYSVVIDCISQHFTIDGFLRSIVNTEMEPMTKDIGRQQEAGQWMTKDNHPLQAKALYKNLTKLLSMIEVQVEKNASRADLLRGQVRRSPAKVKDVARAQPLLCSRLRIRAERAAPNPVAQLWSKHRQPRRLQPGRSQSPRLALVGERRRWCLPQPTWRSVQRQQ